jgi:hypothetical protein
MSAWAPRDQTIRQWRSASRPLSTRIDIREHFRALERRAWKEERDDARYYAGDAGLSATEQATRDANTDEKTFL